MTGRFGTVVTAMVTPFAAAPSGPSLLTVSVPAVMFTPNAAKGPVPAFVLIDFIAADPELHWRAMLRHHQLKKPLVAAVEGYALAGGFEIMLACDFAYAVPAARFALTPESRAAGRRRSRRAAPRP